jgi:hypothetical protein
VRILFPPANLDLVNRCPAQDDAFAVGPGLAFALLNFLAHDRGLIADGLLHAAHDVPDELAE